jgi:FK506-binding nuclear protein
LDEDSESDDEGYAGDQLQYDLSPDEDELDEISESEDDALDGLQDPRITEVGSDDEEAPKLVTKKGKNKRPAESSDVEEPSLDALMSKDAKSEAPATNGEQKLSKKQAKKLKKNDGQAVAAAQEPAKKEKVDASSDKKKVQFAKNLELGPTGSPKVEEKKDEKKDAKKEAPKGPRVVQGVTIEDKKEGKGRAAKKGDKIEMRYIGKLKNGKQFDCKYFTFTATNLVLTLVSANKKGKPFSFKLGVGEVIKGWDIGVMGMTAGSERRLSIPAKHAYGNKALPDIPANSELIFDIKCISVS